MHLQRTGNGSPLPSPGGVEAQAWAWESWRHIRAFRGHGSCCGHCPARSSLCRVIPRAKRYACSSHLVRKKAKQASQPLAPSPIPRTCRSHPCFPANQLPLGCGQGHLSVRALGHSLDHTLARAARHGQSLPTCVLQAALLLPPWTLVLGPGPPTCPHLLQGGLLSTNSNSQRQTSHLGGSDGHLRLDPCSRAGSPLLPGAQTKARESLLPPLTSTCIPSVQKCCGRNRQNVSRGRFLSPCLHTEAGTRRTPTAAHRQVSREAGAVRLRSALGSGWEQGGSQEAAPPGTPANGLQRPQTEGTQAAFPLSS
ncbi:uncharacterized protein LOC135362892 [Mirounga angustirostris]|uniref:uncharacterized protein LOC135362892 n=1 Tax=Mirounga angustirostris TaxID=9716 RepID=UPI00313B0A71